MTDTTDTAASDAPTPEQIEAAQALLAAAAAAVPLADAMTSLVASPEFDAGLSKLAAALALYPAEPSNDLQYAVLSMNRLRTRYGA